MSELANLLVFCEGVKTTILHSSQKAELDNLLNRTQAEHDDLLTDRDGLVRYIAAYTKATKKHIGFLYAHGYKDLTDADTKEAYEALSQELKDEIAK